MLSTSSQKVPAREGVDKLFNRIARRYDFLNRLLSFRQDVLWRSRLKQYLPHRKDLSLLDLATGTADILITLKGQCSQISKALGIDFSVKMLQLAQQKTKNRALNNTFLSLADVQNIPLPDNSFDIITMGFGIRNVKNLNRCLSEAHRILKTGGKFLILEFSLPSSRSVRALYLFYFRHVLPHIGSIISGDYQAYRYLNQTVETFPYGDSFCRLMRQSGFRRASYIPLTFGIAAIYIGSKPENAR